MTAAITITPGAFSLADLRAIWGGAAVSLDPAAWQAVDASAASIARILESGRTVYGVNTGFGLLAQTRIPRERLAELQRNLVLSHSCGLGPDLPAPVVRLTMAMKVAALARGHSGVRRVVIERLLQLLDADALPSIPAQGSVGASGDLAPLGHLSAALLGEGHIEVKGERLDAGEALQTLGIEPLELGPKEGIALLNGTQVSAALALDALFTGERVFASALLTGALSVDAYKGTDAAFDPRLHVLRGQPGQIEVAAIVRHLLEGSEIRASHAECDKVQDPYSFRCQPQVMGACLDVMRNTARTLEIEASAVTDNPLVFADTDEAVSGGNFHAEPVGFAADMLAMALCEVGSMSERRTAVLIDPKMSGLPPFLVEDSGVNSGFMIPQVTAAALVSENKSLAFPATVDSIPTSAGQEDHVSMATIAGRKARSIAQNAAGVVGIELLASVQGIDFHAPLHTSPAMMPAVAEIMVALVPAHFRADCGDELHWAQDAVLTGAFSEAIERQLF
jgi:histidine ammonia-lyase